MFFDTFCSKNTMPKKLKTLSAASEFGRSQPVSDGFCCETPLLYKEAYGHELLKVAQLGGYSHQFALN